MKSYLFFIVTLAIVLIGGSTSAQPLVRPSNTLFIENTGTVSTEGRARTEKTLAAILRDMDIELVAVCVADLGGEDIDIFTNKIFEQWKIGSTTKANRGLLFVMAQKEQQARLEVAYGLEAIFPDAYVSYIAHEQMKPVRRKYCECVKLLRPIFYFGNIGLIIEAAGSDGLFAA